MKLESSKSDTAASRKAGVPQGRTVMAMDKIESVASPCKKGQSDEVAWDMAWAWVKRHYELGGFDPIIQREFVAWIAAAPGNRAAYENAAQVWLMAGLVPPVNDVPISGCDDALD